MKMFQECETSCRFCLLVLSKWSEYELNSDQRFLCFFIWFDIFDHFLSFLPDFRRWLVEWCSHLVLGGRTTQATDLHGGPMDLRWFRAIFFLRKKSSLRRGRPGKEAKCFLSPGHFPPGASEIIMIQNRIKLCVKHIFVFLYKCK